MARKILPTKSDLLILSRLSKLKISQERGKGAVFKIN